MNGRSWIEEKREEGGIDLSDLNDKETREERRTSSSEIIPAMEIAVERVNALSSIKINRVTCFCPPLSKVWKDFLTARRGRLDNILGDSVWRAVGCRCRDSSRVRWLRRIDTGRRITKLYAVYKRRGTKVTVVGGAAWRWIVGSLACNSR